MRRSSKRILIAILFVPLILGFGLRIFRGLQAPALRQLGFDTGPLTLSKYGYGSWLWGERFAVYQGRTASYAPLLAQFRNCKYWRQGMVDTKQYARFIRDHETFYPQFSPDLKWGFFVVPNSQKSEFLCRYVLEPTPNKQSTTMYILIIDFP